MFRNIYYDYKNSIMHLWYTTEDGIRKYASNKWVPYVFIKDPTGSIHTVDGIAVRQKTFNSYYDKKTFENRITRGIYENKVLPEIQFLVDNFHHIPDDEITSPFLKIYTIDIEVNATGEFPSWKNAVYPITVISVYNNEDDKVYVFGIKNYVVNDNDIVYKKCKNDDHLLDEFVKWIHENPPDVITGWNIGGFDLPYIIERSRFNRGNDEQIKRLGPLNIVSTWLSNTGEYKLDIPGISWLDYLEIYKSFTGKRLNNYKLDTVASEELGEGKLDYSEFGYGAAALNRMFEKNYQKYVDYNIIDVKRVAQLEDKLGYIRTNIQGLSLLCKVPLKLCSSQTKLLEGALLVYFRRNNLCAPYFNQSNDIPSYKGAVVKDPLVGFYDYIIDVDITSSYPSHVITLNMSLETYYGRIYTVYNENTERYYLNSEFTNDVDIIKCVENKEFPPFKLRTRNGQFREISGKHLHSFNKALKQKLFSIAPCGTIFINTKRGCIADIQRLYFIKRKETKQKMHQLKKKASSLIGKEKSKLLEKANKLNAFQIALKVLLNSTYGATAVPYSRYYNPDMSLAITSCGYNTIQQAQNYANEYMQSKAHTNKDYVIYIDTDSLYLALGQFLDDYKYEIDGRSWREVDEKIKIDHILKFAKEIQEFVNVKTFENTQLNQYNSNVTDFKIQLKQEVVARTALFLKKKRYAYWAINEEGINVDKIVIKGIEVVRSDTPKIIRKYLKNVLDMILKNIDADIISKHINEYMDKMYVCDVEDIAATVGINDLGKYIDVNDNPKQLLNKAGNKQGLSWHIKGVINYRKLRKHLNLEAKYENLRNGDKVNVVYLKKNPFNFETLSFQEWPVEFEEHGLHIDRSKMIEKYFLRKLLMILTPIKREYLLNYEDEEVNKFF